MSGGKPARDKGRRGQQQAAPLLLERGFDIIETPCGRSVEDFYAEKDGHRYAIECKNVTLLNFPAFRKQAREQARKRGKRVRWLLVCRVPQHTGTWYVEGSHQRPAIWRDNSCRAVGE